MLTIEDAEAAYEEIIESVYEEVTENDSENVFGIIKDTVQDQTGGDLRNLAVLFDGTEQVYKEAPGGTESLEKYAQRVVNEEVYLRCGDYFREQNNKPIHT